MRDSRRSNAGFSLLELMIAIALMAIVVSQVFVVFTTQRKSYEQQERVSEAQSDARLITDTILTDLRMAGFMVPKEAAVGSNDGGTNGSDILCMSDPSVIAEDSYLDATSRLSGASVLTTLTGGDTTISLSSTAMDIDEDGNDDFIDGAGILISDGTRVHCARITDVTGSSVTFAPATPDSTTFAAVSTVAVPALVYEVTGTTLSRNGVALSDQIEDLQVQFGVDEDSDGTIASDEFPLDTLTGSTVSQVRLARLHVTSRVPIEEEDFVGQREAAANRTAGAGDAFRRRRVTTDTLLRNVR